MASGKLRSHTADASFLFSTWPIPEWRNGHQYVVMGPSGGNDTPLMQAAVNRLSAIGGGVVRLGYGDYDMAEPVYLEADSGER